MNSIVTAQQRMIGPAPQDLLVGITAMFSALFIIIAVAVFTFFHSIIFILIPASEMILGVLLLVNSSYLISIQSFVPYLSQVVLLDRSVVVMIGILSLNYFIRSDLTLFHVVVLI